MTGVPRRPGKPIPARPAAPRIASRSIITRPVLSSSSTSVKEYRNSKLYVLQLPNLEDK